MILSVFFSEQAWALFDCQIPNLVYVLTTTRSVRVVLLFPFFKFRFLTLHWSKQQEEIYNTDFNEKQHVFERFAIHLPGSVRKYHFIAFDVGESKPILDFWLRL